MFLIVSTHIFEVEALGQVVVNLNGAQLPAAADCVANHKVEFRTIEGCLAVFNHSVKVLLFAGLDNLLLGLCPKFVAAHVFLVVVGVTKRYLCLNFVEVQSLENDLDNVHNLAELLFHLVGTAEQVRVVLRERTNTCKSVKLTTLLVTVNGSELCNSQRKVFV